jgi:hypothetical protein
VGPAYYVIAILGCADGSAQCAPVATVPTHYSSQEACSAATADALVARSDLDFPTIVAQCNRVGLPAVGSNDQPARKQPQPRDMRRG